MGNNITSSTRPKPPMPRVSTLTKSSSITEEYSFASSSNCGVLINKNIHQTCTLQLHVCNYTDKHTYRERDTHTPHTDTYIETQTQTQTDRHTDRQTQRQTDTDRHTDTDINTQTVTYSTGDFSVG